MSIVELRRNGRPRPVPPSSPWAGNSSVNSVSQRWERRPSSNVRVTRGALYHQFDGKRGLFAAVYDDVERDVTADIASAVGELAMRDPVCRAALRRAAIPPVDHRTRDPPDHLGRRAGGPWMGAMACPGRRVRIRPGGGTATGGDIRRPDRRPTHSADGASRSAPSTRPPSMSQPPTTGEGDRRGDARSGSVDRWFHRRPRQDLAVVSRGGNGNARIGRRSALRRHRADQHSRPSVLVRVGFRGELTRVDVALHSYSRCAVLSGKCDRPGTACGTRSVLGTVSGEDFARRDGLGDARDGRGDLDGLPYLLFGEAGLADDVGVGGGAVVAAVDGGHGQAPQLKSTLSTPGCR